MRTRAVAAAVIAATVALLSSGCGFFQDGAYDLPLPGGPDLGDDPYTVRVQFRDVEQLVPKSLVKVDNVRVGMIESINVDSRNWTATAVCKIRGDVRLPANATARVRRSSLLGQSFVALAPPTQEQPRGRLTDGAVVPLERSTTSAPVEQILGALSMLLNGGALPQLQTITDELNNALGGNTAKVRSLLGELNTLVGRLDASRHDITRALDKLNQLSGTLDEHRQQLATALDRLPGAVEVLAKQRDELVTMLNGLDELSRVAVRVVEGSNENIVADLQALRPILRKLTEAGANLTDALPILATFPFTTKSRQAFKGDFLNIDIAVDLNLGTALGNLANSNQPLNVNGKMLPNPFAILRRESGQDDTKTATRPGTQEPGNAAPAPPVPSAGAQQPSPQQPSPSPNQEDGGLPGLLGPLLGGRP